MTGEISDHDRQLAAYRAYTLTTWCENCGEPTTVDYVEENGQGTITPEECETCRVPLRLDPSDPPPTPPQAA